MLFYELDGDASVVERFDGLEQIEHVAAQAIHRVDDERIALAQVFERRLQLGAFCVLTARLVSEDLHQLHPLELTLGMLVEGGDPDIADQLSLVFWHARLLRLVECLDKSKTSIDTMSNNANWNLFGRVFKLGRLSG